MNTRTEDIPLADTGHWRLIDSIYEAGRHPQAWPALLDSLYTSLRLSDFQDSGRAVEYDADLRLLWSHFERALQLNRHIDRFDRTVLDEFAARIRYPLAVINSNRELILASEPGGTGFPPLSGVFLEGEHVRIELPEIETALQALFDPRTESTGGPVVIPMPCADRPKNFLVVISLPHASGPLVALAWFDSDDKGRLSASNLRQLFGLTASEANTVEMLVRGDDTDAIATARGISPATVRSHLKSIYRKTLTAGKTELIQTIKCGPVFLQRFMSPRTNMFADGAAASERRNRTLELAHGRRLGYAEYGSADGEPMLLIHNLIGSRLQLPASESNIDAHQIRLVMPDRPGVGLSDPMLPFSFRSWSEDAVRLADHLKIDTFDLVGSSMGAIYALALARYFPDRVRKLAVVSCLPQISRLTDLRVLPKVTRRILTLARYVPTAASYLMKVVLQKGPQAYLDQLVCDLPARDQRLYEDAAFQRTMGMAVQETLRNGNYAMLRDLRSMSGPWGFSPSDIEVPVCCWHGTADETAPHKPVMDLLGEIPRSEIRLLAGETHWLLYRQWNAIVDALKA